MNMSFVVSALVVFLCSCTLTASPTTPVFEVSPSLSKEPETSRSSIVPGVKPNRPTSLPLQSVGARRVLYIASVGDDGDEDVYSAIKNRLTQDDAYFSYFRYIDQGIDEIRLEDRANLAVDQLQRANERFGAELYLLFSNPTEESLVEVTLSLYCIQNSELISNSTRRLSGASNAGGETLARVNAAQGALDELTATYFRRVSVSCPSLKFEEN